MTQATLSSGDTAWVLTSSALVLLMTQAVSPDDSVACVMRHLPCRPR